MDIFLIYLVCFFWMSLIGFMITGFDRNLTFFNRNGIPDWLLIIISVINGAFGVLCGMIFFKNKIQHTVYLVLVPILTLFQIAIAIILRIL